MGGMPFEEYRLHESSYGTDFFGNLYDKAELTYLVQNKYKIILSVVFFLFKVLFFRKFKKSI